MSLSVKHSPELPVTVHQFSQQAVVLPVWLGPAEPIKRQVKAAVLDK